MRLVTIERPHATGLWKYEGPGYMPEKWNGFGVGLGWTWSLYDIRIVTAESAREDYGVKVPS